MWLATMGTTVAAGNDGDGSGWPGRRMGVAGQDGKWVSLVMKREKDSAGDEGDDRSGWPGRRMGVAVQDGGWVWLART